MATDIERVTVRMSADFRAFTNELARATGVSKREFAKIKREAEAAGANIDRARVGFGRSAQASTGNVIAFRSGVQQAAFPVAGFRDPGGRRDRCDRGPRAAAAPAARRLRCLGPVIGADVAVGIPLVTAAIRGLGDEAVPLEDRLKTLTDALSAVKGAAEMQALSIEELTKRYGAADAAVQQLIASTARLAIDQALAQVREMGTLFGEFTDLRLDAPLGGFRAALSEVDELNRGLEATMQTFGVTEEQARRLQQAFLDFRGAAAQGPEAAFQASVRLLDVLLERTTATGELSAETVALATEVQRLADTMGQVRGGVEDVTAATAAAATAAQGLAAAWGSVAQASAQAAQMAAAASREAGNRSAPGTFAAPPATPFGGPNDFRLYDPTPEPADFPVFYPAPAAVSSSGGGGGGRGGGSGSSAASRAEADAVRAQQRAIADGIREVELAQRDLERRNERVAASFADVFTDAITGAQSLQESIAGIAQQLGSLLVQRGFETLLNGTGGGALGFLFGGARANGGPVTAGRSYLVGERGPEMFIPRMGGRSFRTMPAAAAARGVDHG